MVWRVMDSVGLVKYLADSLCLVKNHVYPCLPRIQCIALQHLPKTAKNTFFHICHCVTGAEKKRFGGFVF